MNIAEATLAPRFHHQWKPDLIRLEKGISSDTQRLLTNKGYSVKTMSNMGSSQSIILTDGHFYGYSDTRKQDALCLGF